MPVASGGGGIQAAASENLEKRNILLEETEIQTIFSKH